MVKEWGVSTTHETGGKRKAKGGERTVKKADLFHEVSVTQRSEKGLARQKEKLRFRHQFTKKHRGKKKHNDRKRRNTRGL